MLPEFTNTRKQQAHSIPERNRFNRIFSERHFGDRMAEGLCAKKPSGTLAVAWGNILGFFTGRSQPGGQNLFDKVPFVINLWK